MVTDEQVREMFKAMEARLDAKIAEFRRRSAERISSLTTPPTNPLAASAAKTVHRSASAVVSEQRSGGAFSTMKFTAKADEIHQSTADRISSISAPARLERTPAMSSETTTNLTSLSSSSAMKITTRPAWVVDSKQSSDQRVQREKIDMLHHQSPIGKLTRPQASATIITPTLRSQSTENTSSMEIGGEPGPHDGQEIEYEKSEPDLHHQLIAQEESSARRRIFDPGGPTVAQEESWEIEYDQSRCELEVPAVVKKNSPRRVYNFSGLQIRNVVVCIDSDRRDRHAESFMVYIISAVMPLRAPVIFYAGVEIGNLSDLEDKVDLKRARVIRLWVGLGN